MPLYVAATPIGNLSEAPPRLVETLRGADLVLCEDTRRTRALLSALGVPAPTLWRCDAATEADQAPAVLERLRGGAVVVLVSDAGTPAISDPGTTLVRAVHAAGLPVHALGGPSSVAAALSVSGLPGVPFHFLGFPPRKPGPLGQFIDEASRLPGTLVLLERGERVGELIAALAERLPDREGALCRELTKLHEEIRLDRLGALPREGVLGECVLVVGPGAPVATAQAEAPSGEGLGPLAEALAARWGSSRREAYQALLRLERERTS